MLRGLAVVSIDSGEARQAALRDPVTPASTFLPIVWIRKELASEAECAAARFSSALLADLRVLHRMSQTASIEPVAELLGHSDRVWAVDWNPRQPLIASCSGDKTVRLHSYSLSDPPSFRHAHTLDGGHSRTIRSLHWRPDGRALATSSFDSTVGIWEEVREAGIEDGGAAGALVDDFRDEDGTEGTWECSASLEGHENEVKMVKWSAKGDLLATCGRDKSVWVWEGSSSL